MDKLNINLAGMVVHESMWVMLRKFWMAVFTIMLSPRQMLMLYYMM